MGRDKQNEKDWKRRWYLANKDRHTALSRASAARRKAIYENLKSGPCVDCGTQYPPCVMQFDHVRGDKKAIVSDLARRRSVATMLAEIEKCDLVCANCHAVRTSNRLRTISKGAIAPLHAARWHGMFDGLLLISQ